MTIPFDYPPNNLTNVVVLFTYINSLVNGFLGVAILLIVGLVAFLSTKAFTTEQSLGFSSFLTLITAIFLRFLNLITDFILYIVVVIFVLSVIFLMRQKNVENFGV